MTRGSPEQRRKWYLAAKHKQRLDPEFRKKEHERRNKKKIWEAHRKRTATPEGWRKYLIPHIRSRAKANGIEFDLVAEDIPLPDVCPVFGTKLVYGTEGKSTFHDRNSSPSVDRTDNSKGYVKGNIDVISNRANILKKDATADEIAALHRYMEGKKRQSP